MYDLIVIGAGPSGITSAIYAKRSNLNVLVLYNGKSNLEKATKIDNYYGFPIGIDGKELFENGIKQAKNLNIDVKKEEVINISEEISEYSNNIDNTNNEITIFKVKTTNGEYSAKSIIIATGNKKIAPSIKGINEFEGKGISYCAICDAFFYKNKDVAVIGNGNYALSEVDILKNVANKVYILTNGEKVEDKNLTKFKDVEIIDKKIREISGKNVVNGVIFEDDSVIKINGIFIALGEAGAVDFAKVLGILLDKNNNIIVDENMMTNIPGIFACGNVIGGLLQVNKSAYEGAKAGLSVTKFLNM